MSVQRPSIVRCTRYGASATALEVSLGDYREIFFVLTGDRSVTISSIDESDATHPEAQVFVFAKPYGWSTDLEDEEMMTQVWQAVGVQR